jgi:hypothetical protein
MATPFDFGGLLGGTFGGGLSGLEDLLTPEQRAAIQRQSGLSAAAALLQAAGPSTTRTSLGQALGSAFTAGQAGMQKGTESALTQMLARQKLDEAKRARDLQANIAKILTGGAAPAGGEVTAEEALAVPGMAAGPTPERAALIGQPRPQAAGPQMSGSELKARQYRQMADVYAASGKGEEAKRFMDIAESLAPSRQEVMGQPFEVIGADSKPVMVQQFKDGTLKPVQGFSGRQKVTGQPFEVTSAQGKAVLVQQYEDGSVRTMPGFGPKREVVLQNVDGRMVAIDKSKLGGGEAFGTGRDVRPVDVGGTIRFVDFGNVVPGTTLPKSLAPQVVGGQEMGFFQIGGGAAAAPRAPTTAAATAAAPAIAAAPAGPTTATTGLQPIIPGTGKDFANEKDIRSEFTKAAQPFVDLSQAFQKIENAAKNPSGAGDISLIYGYMKILDPGSVVREGEFATAANAGGIPDSVKSVYNKALSGQRLSDNVRSDFLGQARNLIESQRTLSDDLVERYKNLANQYKLQPHRVVFDPFKRVKKHQEIIGGVSTPGTGFIQQFNLIPRPR